MNKQENDRLIARADEILRQSTILQNGRDILKSYNGQVAALGVSVIMSGLRPTLAIYYQDYENDTRNAYRRNVLDIIARMLGDYTNAEVLLDYALGSRRSDIELATLKTNIINCSIALKQVIRTYNLK